MMWKFNDQSEEINLDNNEIRFFQYLLNNFENRMNNIQTNYNLLTKSK